MSLKQKSNDIIDEMDMDLKIAEEELTKDFDNDEDEDAEFESYDDDDNDDDDDETEEDKQIKRTRHGKPTPYAPKNGSAPHLKHLYANYGSEVMPYINMFDLQLSYETSDIELLYHLCERINKMIDIINAENKYINKLTDWTEKKIHKLFKHQKKFEKYLLKLLNEFEEQMQEEFSEFKNEITKEIEDFENLVNEELEAMNEEINRFENEMKERADAFEAEMKERADAFEAEMKSRADAFEAEVNSRLDEMDKEITDFEYEMKLRADNFENTINNTISEFETEMRNRASEFEETMEKEQSNYENEMNTRATEFESSMNNRADNFETSISKEINDFKTETTNEINEFESLVNSTINDFSTDWTTKLNDFETYINHHIEEFESSMDERADSFESELKAEWNDFKTKFSDMYNEYITDISNQWNEFKEEITNEWASEKEDLENEMASYEETMNENYNEFKESIESYIEACCENVNSEISSFEETVNKLIEDFENEYNTRLEETTKEEVDAKITDIVNQSIYELIQNSEEFRNAISNVVNQLLEESETLKEMITDIINNIIHDIDLANFDTSIINAIDLILEKKPQILSTNTDNGYQIFYYDTLIVALDNYNGYINFYKTNSKSLSNLSGFNTKMTSHVTIDNDSLSIYTIATRNGLPSIEETITDIDVSSFKYRYYTFSNIDMPDTDIYQGLANFYNIIVYNKETNKSSVYATNVTEHETDTYEATLLFETDGEITSFISDSYNMAYVINEEPTIYYINDYRHYKSNISVSLYNCDDFTHIYDMQLYNDKASITATTNLFNYSENDSCIYTLLYPFDNFSNEKLLQLKYNTYITTIQYNNNNYIPTSTYVTTPERYTALYDFSLNLGINEENDEHTDYLINNGYMFSLALAYININKINNGYEHQLTLNLDRELETSSTFEHDNVFNSLYINDASYCNVYMFSDIKHVWVNNSIVTYYGRNEAIGNFENLPTVSDLQVTDSYLLLYLATSILSHLMRCYIIMYGSQYLNETHCNSCILLANIISSRLENKFELTDGHITDLRDFTYTSTTFNYEDK